MHVSHNSRGREWSENCDNIALFEMQGKPSPIIIFKSIFNKIKFHAKTS